MLLAYPAPSPSTAAAIDHELSAESTYSTWSGSIEHLTFPLAPSAVRPPDWNMSGSPAQGARPSQKHPGPTIPDRCPDPLAALLMWASPWTMALVHVHPQHALKSISKNQAAGPTPKHIHQMARTDMEISKITLLGYNHTQSLTAKERVSGRTWSASVRA